MPKLEIGEPFKQLWDHFFKKADVAVEKLSGLLLEPVVNECAALKSFLNDGDPNAIPVSTLPFFFVLCTVLILLNLLQ